MKAVSMACPKCGAPMKLSEKDDIIECEYCGNAMYSPRALKKMAESANKRESTGILKNLSEKSPEALDSMVTTIEAIVFFFGWCLVMIILDILH